MQPVKQLEKLGIGHIMMLGLDEDTCKAVSMAVPELGCIWMASTPGVDRPADMGDKAWLWHARYKLRLRWVHRERQREGERGRWRNRERESVQGKEEGGRVCGGRQRVHLYKMRPIRHL